MPGKLPIGEPGESLSDDSSPDIPDRLDELEHDRPGTDAEFLKSFKKETLINLPIVAYGK